MDFWLLFRGWSNGYVGLHYHMAATGGSWSSCWLWTGCVLASKPQSPLLPITLHTETKWRLLFIIPRLHYLLSLWSLLHTMFFPSDFCVFCDNLEIWQSFIFGVWSNIEKKGCPMIREDLCTDSGCVLRCLLLCCSPHTYQEGGRLTGSGSVHFHLIFHSTIHRA